MLALTCSRDGNNDTGGGAHGRRLSLPRVTTTTTLAEARADVSSTCSRDGDDVAPRRGIEHRVRGRRLSLA